MSESVLFVWDATARSSRRRTFYRKLFGYKDNDRNYPGLLHEIPKDNWSRVNMSVLLIDKRSSQKVRKLMREFEDILDWREFRVNDS